MIENSSCISLPLQSLQDLVNGLYVEDTIERADKRRFDRKCLTRIKKFGPDGIRKIREQSRMSQATFAMALNVSAVLVSKWERGEVRPSGPSLKLLSLADSKGIEAIL
jgi:putative transcriptional regulator